MKLEILDCTLRDGGYVNDFLFGENLKIDLLKNLNDSKIEIIELGFLKNGNHERDSTLYNKINDVYKYINIQNLDSKLSLMIRPDWYDINLLEKDISNSIGILRFAFHLKDLELTLHQAEISRSLGYEIYLNPVNITSYSDLDLVRLLKKIDSFKPEGASVVDTFGSLLPNKFKNIINLFDKYLSKDIKLGIHLHENLSLSMGLASIFLEKFYGKRNIIIDSSLNGMGRIPGNLPTELISSFLNKEYYKNYDLQKILYGIDRYIIDFKKHNNWGYLPAYSKSAIEFVHRSYAEYFYNNGLKLDEVFVAIEKIKSTNFLNEFNEELAFKVLNSLHNE
jgi:4-hydroxy 2-oxovalerate aldolase